MKIISKYLFQAPFATLEFHVLNDESLIYLKPAKENIIQDIETDFSNLIKKELSEYFTGKRKTFDINLTPNGTNFQKRVWKEILKIPYGQTETYGEIALNLGGKNYSRAIGGACNKNPLMIFIPCHRVISSNRDLGGYAFGLDIKKQLLNFENKNA